MRGVLSCVSVRMSRAGNLSPAKQCSFPKVNQSLIVPTGVRDSGILGWSGCIRRMRQNRSMKVFGVVRQILSHFVMLMKGCATRSSTNVRDSCCTIGCKCLTSLPGGWFKALRTRPHWRLSLRPLNAIYSIRGPFRRWPCKSESVRVRCAGSFGRKSVNLPINASNASAWPRRALF